MRVKDKDIDYLLYSIVSYQLGDNIALNHLALNFSICYVTDYTYKLCWLRKCDVTDVISMSDMAVLRDMVNVIFDLYRKGKLMESWFITFTVSYVFHKLVSNLPWRHCLTACLLLPEQKSSLLKWKGWLCHYSDLGYQ